MKVVLEPRESEEYFFNALCNGAGWIGGYGLKLDCLNHEYSEARDRLKEKFGEDRTVCVEDVWMEILRQGGTLTLIDQEYGGEYTKSIKLADVHERVANTPIDHLMDMIEERDDAITADCIIQTVFYSEVIFG